MTTALQATLNIPEDFHPVPAGTGHYVAALQAKNGELDALRHASPRVWSHVTPIIEVVGPTHPGTDPFKRQRVHDWIKRMAKGVGTHPCFLDVLRLSPNHLTDLGKHTRPVLSVLHGMARKRGILFVPVLRLGDVKATVAQIADTAACDGRGVALRVPLLGTAAAEGRSTETLAKEALEAVGVSATGADLLMDLRYLSEDMEIDVDYLAPMIDRLIAIGAWHSVVLLGTTMPQSLGGGIVETGTIGRLPRKEWLLWSTLRRSQVSRLPTYGDYAVQHPDPPLDIAEGQIPLGMRANIRYTHDTVTVIPRAKAPRYEEGREQYRELCRVLVAQPEFLGRAYSWGDEQIADCASGVCEPGWENHWRGAGTSHHLRFVVDQLAAVN